ncbi:MAG: hypothetical protein ACLS3F_03500 [Oscillospiraceae bacterium]
MRYSEDGWLFQSGKLKISTKDVAKLIFWIWYGWLKKRMREEHAFMQRLKREIVYQVDILEIFF